MTSTVTPKKYLLRTAELAAAIGASPKTVRNWRTQGYGPRYVRLSPNDVRYDPADIEAWIAAVKRTGSVKAVPLAGAVDA